MQTSLKQTQIASPLMAQSALQPKGHTANRVLVSSLMLTSLVDAFSILVIFLLMSTQNGIELELKKTEKLPMATAVDGIEKSIVLRIEGDRYFIDDEPVGERELAKALIAAKDKFESGLLNKAKAALLVQADREMDFVALSPVLHAGSAAGLSQFKFAAIEGQRPRQ
ncbi:MAG: biopolymer transporter ExbD [Bdellovibrionaceae bacterium]|nr:biopolymer transporter ExbD [Pseudobdellovibrionaceae bacterium]